MLNLIRCESVGFRWSQLDAAAFIYPISPLFEQGSEVSSRIRILEGDIIFLRGVGGEIA